MLKKFAEPFATESIAKRMFGEIITLKHLKHENVRNCPRVSNRAIALTKSDRQFGRYIHVTFRRHVCCPPSNIWNPCSNNRHSYLISELMETDLQTLLRTRGIEKEYVQYFLYQMMRGLKYAHSAGVFHHDLKPSQILVNRNCDLKICNFGIAHVQKLSPMAYGSILHYKAPEVLISRQSYHGQTDIWSAGCIFAELLMGTPLFPGDNTIHQLHAITKLLGSPPDHMLIKEITKNRQWPLLNGTPEENDIQGASSKISHGRFQISYYYFQEVKAKHCLPFCQTTKFVPTAAAIDILTKMIVFDPHKRATASETLTFPYLAPYHDPTDEPEAKTKLDWRLAEADYPLKAWKAKVYVKINLHLGPRY
ncbi:mitogen-activated protein kinase HOG1 [Penicillium atrosanguineum]|uniref:uncharacterized protein n=1 Tax=Penicillium atrosanguineum TaxID=1132637 RepID=UPI00239AD535|nr:uncharacterized protein N7443_009109 [Penicillium atrosanguineum]KAJ5126070.1 mitogen-activated protein kinase HOG1 [Penicillium atrosanguineum]KAJ5136824.1 mitogen-activated protein kinase HOG1 [Penicillium atrosanguineum]KAJ5293156.1 hypothetical protein N7443_009109 [Penicillium atrosanguineum]